jgi:putative transposase
MSEHVMKRKKRFGGEQIPALLRQIDGATSQGISVGAACRQAGISDHTYYRWRKQYAGLGPTNSERQKSSG